MVARALWRSEAFRVVPWLRPCTRLRLCTSRRRVQGRSQGTTLRASDLHNARATILNPFTMLGKGAPDGHVMLYAYNDTSIDSTWKRVAHLIAS